MWDEFSVGKWYAERCAVHNKDDAPCETANKWMKECWWGCTTLSGQYLGYWKNNPKSSTDDHDDNDNDLNNDPREPDIDDFENCLNFPESDTFSDFMEISENSEMSCEDDAESVLLSNSIQVDKNKYVSLQRNAVKIKGAAERLLPKPVVLKVAINGCHT